MLRISYICKKNNIKIIEDQPHSLGAIQYNKFIGNCEFSEITVFSLHPAKIIPSAEGGLATSQNPALIEKMRLLFLTRDNTWRRHGRALEIRYDKLRF